MQRDNPEPLPESPQNEPAVARWLRNPLLIGVAILGTVAGAFRIAGLTSLLLAKLMLIFGVWLFVTVEVWCSKWIRKTGGYFGSVILMTAFVSGTAAVGLALTIVNLKKQQTTETSVPSPTQTPTPVPAAPSSPKAKIRLEAIFVNPNHLGIFLTARGGLVRDPKYAVLLWNPKRDQLNMLPSVSTTNIGDFLKEGQTVGPLNALSTQEIPLISNGDLLVGLSRIDCSICDQSQDYWIYYRYGVGGWYSPLPAGQLIDFKKFANAIAGMKDVDSEIESYFSSIKTRMIISDATR